MSETMVYYVIRWHGDTRDWSAEPRLATAGDYALTPQPKPETDPVAEDADHYSNIYGRRAGQAAWNVRRLVGQYCRVFWHRADSRGRWRYAAL